jgi:c-di-GMP-binding flagellar brake protein YcgR
MAPKEKELEPVKDKKVVERYLRYALDFREKFSGLVEPGPLRFDAFLRAFDAENFVLSLQISDGSYDLLGESEKRRLDKLPKEIRLSFAVNDVLYFLHARPLAKKLKAIDAEIDLPMFKLQRRDAVRIKVTDSQMGRIEVGEKNYVLHDLSASGLSFVIMPDQEGEFIPKQIFRSCRLRFSGLDVPVDLEVIGLSRLKEENDRLLRVGFRFLGLTAAVEQHLAREAYLHTHKIWSRWI